MTNKQSISVLNFKKRREELKQRRKTEFWQASWRLLLLLAMTGGLCWSIAVPNWEILRKSQIEIKGNRYLTSDAIRELLALSYPESILKIPPHQLVRQLKDNAAIEEVIITRQLLPPRSIVFVRERPPVAIALSPITKLDYPNSYTKEIGFLDEKGIWMPKSSYKKDLGDFEMPTLKVTGSRSHYLAYWQEIYPLLKQAKSEIYELDCQDPANVILKTELGKVHFGVYNSSAKFKEQLSVLSQMQELPNKISLSQIAYIDLNNPKSPKIQLHYP